MNELVVYQSKKKRDRLVQRALKIVAQMEYILEKFEKNLSK